MAGRRDRALLLTFVLTGRRRSEVIGLTAGDITLEGETAFYAYRGKGGKRGRRELPRPAYEAICRTLADVGLELARWGPMPRSGRPAPGRPGLEWGRLRPLPALPAAAGLAPSGLHILRHTAAKLRRDAGESIEAVSAFLDH